MSGDEQQIRQLMDDWREATKRGDLGAVLKLMTDDAVFLTAGNPPMTRDDFAKTFQSFGGKVKFDATQQVREICVSGNLAYAWSHLALEMTFTENGRKVERAGHILTVMRKSSSGQWLLARDANLLTVKAPEH